ncbi:DEAD/DEAH box helicase [Lentzea kentuckyensis]|uniref:DEAD/DEAH box helicase n=1 Tax=Lentzea kentuckyensis TaxID=360086 RepID=UPI001302A8EF|nr:DEAD/DEAH box helicase [Lentzea kentuckyensis]
MPEADNGYAKLGRHELWDRASLQPPVNQREAGKRVYETIRGTATADWQQHSPEPERKITGEDRIPRLSFYFWARSVAKHQVTTSDGVTKDRNYATGSNYGGSPAYQIMAQYFKEPVGPSVMSGYVRQTDLKKGNSLATSPDVQAWLKSFAHTVWLELARVVDELDVPAPDGPDQELLWQLMPSRLAAAMIAQLNGNPLNDMQRWALTQIPKAIASKQGILIAAPTGTGKSKISQALLAHGAHGPRGSAVAVLPLKALVTQEADEWAKLMEASQLGWSVLPASRDYPENDGKVANGRFQIALAIYEIIGAYLAAGARPLANARILVVDELQYLGDAGERGFKLESLLTLVKQIPEDHRPTIVGLSATLRPATADPLVQWLDILPENISPAIDRPVAMDAHVLATRPSQDGQYLDYFQKDAHLAGQIGRGELPFDLRTHNYCSIKDLPARTFDGLGVPEKVAAMVVRDILREPQSHERPRQILIFVRSRITATKLVDALARMLDHDDPRPPAEERDPWRSGRYAAQDESCDTGNYEELRTLEQQGMEYAGEFITWLNNGVAPHSAQFLPYIRQQVEAEFLKPNGLLRVIVATDTLAIGMNLPADTVIATRITGYVGRDQESILTPAEMDNKAGRAGRLGKTKRHGTFYLITPPAEKDLEGASPSADEVARLLKPHEVFREYITSPARTTKIRSHLKDDAAMARFVLIALCCQDDGEQPRDRLSARIQKLIEATLRAVEVGHDPDQLPQPKRILELLESSELIRNVRRDLYTLTLLGRAIGRAGLPHSMADRLQRIARLATGGAGPIELLYEAANTEYVHETIKWVAVPRVPHKLSELTDNLREYVYVYATPLADRLQNDRYLNDKHAVRRNAQRTNRLLVAASIDPASEFGATIDADQGEMTLAQADALLRAIIAFEWSRGESFQVIKRRLGGIISPRIPLGTTPDEKRRNEQERKRATLKLYISDVIQMAEQLSSVLAASADVVDTSLSPAAQVRLRALAASVGAGVPTALVKIANLRILTLHRERLLKICTLCQSNDSSWEDVPDVLDAPEHISENDRARVLRVYEEERSGDGHKLRHLLYEDASRVELPEPANGEDPLHLGEWLDQLAELEDVVEYRREWRSLVISLGVRTDVANSEDVQVWSAAGTVLQVRVPDNRVTAELVANADDGIVICWRGLSDRAQAIIAETEPAAVRFVEPREVARIIGLVMKTADEADWARIAVEHLSAGTEPGAAPPPYGDRPMPRPEQVQADIGDVDPIDSPD